jgi:hypothetical protein
MIYFFRFLIATFFLILIYIVYKSEIYWQGNIRQFYLIYFLSTLVLIIFFISILLYLNKKFQEYIIIIFLSTVFSLYFFEIYLFLNTNSIKLDTNSARIKRFEIYSNLKNSKNITLTIPPFASYSYKKKLNFFSLSGVSMSETIDCNENGYYSINKSDRFGFNNPDLEWDAKDIEYFLIGDSMTYGACVNRPNDIGSVLRSLSKKNVLNLGMGGNGPLVELATLKEYLLPNVKKVLWIYFEGNDLIELKNELNDPILIKYLNGENFKQNLKFNQSEINKSLKVIIDNEIEHEKNIIKKETYINIVKIIKLNNLRTKLITPPQVPVTSDLKKILILANEIVKNNNSELYFIYLPALDRYKSYFNKKDDIKQKVTKLVKELNIKFIDIDYEVFKKENDPQKLFPFEKFGHYNVDGYKKVALKIYEKTK